jgi:hypothetical protein
MNEPKPLSYIVVRYDLFPYVLIHPVYKWSDKGDPLCDPTSKGLGFKREAILEVLDIERGEIAAKAVEKAKVKLENVKNQSILQFGNELLETIWELKDKLCYERGKPTYPQKK